MKGKDGIIGFGLALVAAWTGLAGDFKAGFARADLEPPPGLSLSGQFQVRPIGGTLDPVEANAVAVESKGRRAVFISVDLDQIKGLSTRYRERAAKESGVPVEAVYLACTHTHTGPTVGADEDAYEIGITGDPAYDEKLGGIIASVAKRAVGDLRPAELGLARAKAPRPFAPSDDAVQLVRFRRAGAPDIAIVNFRYHPDDAGGRLLVSADWPGRCRRSFERRSGAKCVFFNGAQGDANAFGSHLPEAEVVAMRKDREKWLERAGGAVADAALSVWDGVERVEPGEIRATVRDVTVPVRKPTKEQVAAIASVTDAVVSNRIRKLSVKPASIPVPVSVITIGDALAFAGLPGEPFAAIGRAVKAKSPCRMTVFTCLTNGSYGCIPDPTAELDGKDYATRSTIFPRGASDRLVSAILEELVKTPGLSYERQRKTLLERPRAVIWNTDGCDMLFYPNRRAITEEDFRQVRLNCAIRTRVDSLVYNAYFGFGSSFARKAGEFLTNAIDHATCNNAAERFRSQLGTDALEMAGRFARQYGFEFVVGVRMNDTHDASHSKAHPSEVFSEWKKSHPELLLGDMEGPGRNGYCRWSAVDYGKPEVGDYLRTFVRQTVENYDVDGIEYDFNRHSEFFRSVFRGGSATDADRATMTGILRDLRRITDEVGRKRGRPILVSARTNDSADRTLAEGLDVDAWMREGLIDIWISGGYFQHRPWADSVARARRYGCRVYAAIDESRTEERCRAGGLRCIPGRSRWTDHREFMPFYAARMSAAMAAGMDGVWHFNLENGPLMEVDELSPHELAWKDKDYFATERDPFDANYCMKDGMRFETMPVIFPPNPRKMAAGETYAFRIHTGDDPEAAAKAGHAPTAVVKVQTTGAAPVAVTMNGTRLSFAAADTNGIATASVPSGLLRKGPNEFAITASAPTVVNDFLLSVRYPGGGRDPVLVTFILDGAFDMNDTMERIFRAHGFRIGFAPCFGNPHQCVTQEQYADWQAFGHEVLV